jgi:hypothetical protein
MVAVRSSRWSLMASTLETTGVSVKGEAVLHTEAATCLDQGSCKLDRNRTRLGLVVGRRHGPPRTGGAPQGLSDLELAGRVPASRLAGTRLPVFQRRAIAVPAGDDDRIVSGLGGLGYRLALVVRRSRAGCERRLAEARSGLTNV